MTDSEQWKGIAVKASLGVAALALTALATYKLFRKSSPEEQPAAEEEKKETKLTDVKKVMAKFKAAHPSQNPGEEGNVCDYYNSIDQATYDEFLVYINYIEPTRIVEAISCPEPQNPEDPNAKVYGYLNVSRDAAVFDIGQGTGLMGKLLTQEGYTNIEGADATTNFVKTASESGWYRNSSVIWFGKGVDQLPAGLLGKYDLVMSSGCFLDGHIPAAGFDDAHALCKPGGHFVTSIRSEYYVNGEEHGYKDKLDELIASGKFVLCKKWTYKRGMKDAGDPIFAEMESTMFVCKRIDNFPQ